MENHRSADQPCAGAGAEQLLQLRGRELPAAGRRRTADLRAADLYAGDLLPLFPDRSVTG